MLVLSRKSKESVTITVPPSTEPTTVVVSVGQIKLSKVSIGIAAPICVKVDRSEIATTPCSPPESAH